jgi:hypothetical protein
VSEQLIEVECSPAADGWTCRVTVGRDAGQTVHEVTVSAADLDRFAPAAAEPDALVEASFRFMLEREPREAILRRFELPVIERYFPEYPAEIRRRLDAAG